MSDYTTCGQCDEYTLTTEGRCAHCNTAFPLEQTADHLAREVEHIRLMRQHLSQQPCPRCKETALRQLTLSDGAPFIACIAPGCGWEQGEES